MSNATMHIIESVQVVASSKDSLKVHWNIYDHYVPYIKSYQIQYQAIGSRLVHVTDTINANNGDYEIKELHENTFYNICVKVFTNSTTHDHCVHATTSINSLSVALGSTFGAFLALGVIVLFVFIAKWQHNGTLSRTLRKVTQGREKQYNTMPYINSNGEIELSEVSLQNSSENKTTQMVLMSGTHQYMQYEPTHMEVHADVLQDNMDYIDSQNNSIKILPPSFNPQPSTSALPQPEIHRGRGNRHIDPRLLQIKGYSVDTGPLQSNHSFGSPPDNIHLPIRHNNSCNF